MHTRVWAAVFVSLAASSAAWAQTELAEVVKPGDCFRYDLSMKLTGEVRFRKDSGIAPAKLRAAANHSFPERVLSASGSVVEKAARHYEAAKVTIERGSDRAESTLRPDRKLIVAQWLKGQRLVYSPAGALQRGELDLVSEHFDTLPLAGLLPGKAVKVGETWKLANMEAQALCGLEGMTEHSLEGTLHSVTGDTATLAIQGTASGVEQGALVKATVKAKATYDTKAGRLTSVAWQQTSERDQGPVSPASSMDIEITVTRKAIEVPAELGEKVVASLPREATPPGPMTNLEYRDPKGRYNLVHPRDWHLTAYTGEHTVLRLLDRGDYVAQVTVAPWTRAKKGEHMTPAQFKEAMASGSGWKPEKEIQAGEVNNGATDGRWTYRVCSQGKLDGVEVVQNFYLVAAPTGEQVVLTFTMQPKMADKLDGRDLSMAASIEVPGGK